MVILKTPVLLAMTALILLTPPAQVRSESGLLHEMHAECTHDGIKVHLEFRKPFYGVAYSYGHYETQRCRYIGQGQDSPSPGSTNYSFLIPAGGCGTVQHGTPAALSPDRINMSPVPTQSEEAVTSTRLGLSPNQPRKSHKRSTGGSGDGGSSSQDGNDIYIENTLLIQHDPSIQEAGDLAQTLRCVWQKEIHRPLAASLPIQMTSARRRPTAGGSQWSKYESRVTGSNSGMSQGSILVEPKGQVESVPYYSSSLRRKWSRSLEEPVVDTSGEAGDYESPSLALPLTGSAGLGAWQTSASSSLLLLVTTIPVLARFHL